MTELKDIVDLEQVPDTLSSLWGHPHFNHGCDLVLEVSHCGLVYCGDCASQIGSVDQSMAGLRVGKNGKASRWLSHEAIEQAWKAGDKRG